MQSGFHQRCGRLLCVLQRTVAFSVECRAAEKHNSCQTQKQYTTGLPLHGIYNVLYPVSGGDGLLGERVEVGVSLWTELNTVTLFSPLWLCSVLISAFW